ncbi:MAG: YfhO family protein, partial [Verrucomicrobiota bacterium]
MRTDFDREFTVTRLTLLLGLLMVIYCPEIIVGTHALFYRDAGQFGYPVGMYLRNCLWRGEVPLWNPYSDCGIPFLAQWLTLALYPPSLIYVLLPMPWSMNLYILAHVLLAGMGMYFLARRWFGNRFAASVAGLAFAWNGLALHSWMWPNLIPTLAWMPWVVWLCERARTEGRRTLFLAALAGGMQMLTGSPEEILYTWLIVLGSFLVGVWLRKRGFWAGLGRLSCVAGLVAALAAAQLLPWMDFLAHGDRNTSAGGNDWSMPPWGAANFLVPLFRMVGSISGVFMQPNQAWVSSYYMGVVTLLLALLGVMKVRNARTIFLGALAAGGVLCAMGDTGVVLKVLRTLLPFLGITRYPVKYVIITDFCLPLLAAAGVVWLQGRAAAAVRGSLVLTGAVLAAAVAVLAFDVPFPENSRDLVGMNGLVRLLILAAGIGALLYLARRREKAGQLMVSFGLLLLMGADICTHVPRQNPTVLASDYKRRTPMMTRAPRLGESRTMLAREPKILMLALYGWDLEKWFSAQRSLLYGDLNLLDEVPEVNGFFPIHLREESAVAARLYKDKDAPLPKLQEFLGVSQLCTNLFVWTPQTNFMPWATIGQQPVFKDDAATLNALASPDFEPHQVVYLPLEGSKKVTAAADPRAVIISSNFTAARCVFQTQAATRTMLVVAQSYYHWWKASVDGAAVPLWRANEGFQAVEVPAGRHEVRLIYRDRGFEIGAVVSILALVVCAGGLLTRPKRA